MQTAARSSKKDHTMPKLHYAQIRYLSIVVLAWLTVFALTRSLLLASHLAEANISISNLVGLYAVGLIYDLSFLLYATLPMALYLLLCPRKLWQQSWHKKLMAYVMGLSLYVMLFTAVAEWLFWDEFGVRFNFIAVDYLVYSEEVINNILESYPIYPLIALLAVIAMGVSVALYRPVEAALQAPLMPRGRACAALVALCVLVGLDGLSVGQDSPRGLGGNTYQRELA